MYGGSWLNDIYRMRQGLSHVRRLASMTEGLTHSADVPDQADRPVLQNSKQWPFGIDFLG